MNQFAHRKRAGQRLSFQCVPMLDRLSTTEPEINPNLFGVELASGDIDLIRGQAESVRH